MEGLPTGTVTFLFTDLEGSTRLWEEHPEAMRAALARHDDILQGAVGRHGGAVVKTTGDGLHAVFTTAQEALAAAVAAQRALVVEDWGPELALRVRMGLHTGDAEERAGDYFGPAVNRASRVAAAAHGGQVLVSHATEELARDALPAAVTLTDLGEHRLRDLARPERVFQLVSPDLPGEFPPPRSTDAFPGNLPPQLSSFVGRERDLATISQALREARLVTLTGVGGVGKTRLSIQVAAELLPYYPDGAWLCELAAAGDADAMVQVVAAGLGVPPRPGVTLEGSILEFLAHKQLLVLLDNCEHLLDAAGRLAEAVLHACAGVRILATSREGLGIDGEHIRVVRSLPLPDASATVDDIGAAGAVRLFLDRARAARADVVLDQSSATAVADICRRLDGIPLAIELAAARAVAMSLPDIARRLDERFRLLTGGRRTAVERHHTLRATVDWSYSLLDERDRSVFARLGAFSGSFDAAAAEAVAADADLESWDVLDALTELVGKSMMIAEPGAGTTRYSLLETLRQYARERLDEGGEADAVRRRHAGHYAEVAEQVGGGLRGGVESRAALLADLDNLRAAVTWSLDRQEGADRATALRIVAALASESALDRSLGIGTWAERAVPHAETAPPDVRAAVLAAAAEHLRGRGDLEPARVLAVAAQRDGLAATGPGGVLGVQVESVVVGVTGDPPGAYERLLAARREADAAGLPPSERCVLAILASVWAEYAGATPAARELGEEAIEAARQLRSPGMLAAALFAYGNAVERDEPAAALRAYDESIELAESSGYTSTYAPSLNYSARLMLHAGDVDGTIERVARTLRLCEHLGDWSQMPGAVATAAEVLTELGGLEAAAVLVGSLERGAVADVLVHAERFRFDFDAIAASVRAALDAARFDEATARGARMPFEDLSAFALHELHALGGLGDPAA